MCGITGVFHYGDPERSVDRAALERATRSLAHRGPDGEGFHVDGPVGLGHRRLAILDLTPTGAQPMATEDGSCWIVYNGEFYNHAQYRNGLAGRHRFRGRSDTETLLYLLADSGPEALREASAIFGLAFWDSRSRTLTLARDPVGVKQVYFHDNGQRVLFASEMKALLAHGGVSAELDPEALNQYLHFHTPLRERTFFRGIRQLQPGQWMRWMLGGERQQGRFWDVHDFSSSEETPERWVEELRAGLVAVVGDQLMSDVPVGAFFSGGIDSSAVAAYAKRAGQKPQCFGVHFTGQGVIDERPFQEAAAKALGLDLDLLTLDGSGFPDDLPRLIRQQDQPVIGSAMIPMYHVSRLASSKVKVCLGGQAADEIFGGYARYGLAHPLNAFVSLLRRRRAAVGGVKSVGGNLGVQLRELRTLRRAVENAWRTLDWRALYFNTFARVSESAWREIIAADEVVSRKSCWLAFRESVDRMTADDPAARVMFWDFQTYLPGLLQQDDRMSMAASLESRVPLADPRLVAMAFRMPFSVKVRDGAFKWVLRQAVADVLPPEVLNRRKVGFDTPIERWMRDLHPGFIRDVLLSRRAAERGLWRPRGLEAWLGRTDHPSWSEVVWKALAVELWARAFIDGVGRDVCSESVQGTTIAATVCNDTSTALLKATAVQERVTLRDHVQEFRELGPGGVSFRVRWEVQQRAHITPIMEGGLPAFPEGAIPTRSVGASALRLDNAGVAATMRDRIPAKDLAALLGRAEAARSGAIRMFGRWRAEYGDPPDWHINPVSGRHWPRRAHWSRVLVDEPRVGDVKLTWEIGRFPHAFEMARAACFFPERKDELAQGLAMQIKSFVEENSYALGVHWASGQEIAFRQLAWLFALAVFGEDSPVGEVWPEIVRHLHNGAIHIERHLDYTLKAVYNNHLLSEALLLLIAGTLLPKAKRAGVWQSEGEKILTSQADRQFYPDGGYIQLSHNYERLAVQVYLFAIAFRRALGVEVPREWLGAVGRAADFLHAHQNPSDGRLPNYGSNDGALPGVLTTCDFSDFRPTIQAASIATHGERRYPPGPWDELAAWLFGPGALDAPLCEQPRCSVSFASTGFHLLRGKGEASFAAFRCGSVRDRFSQIDMLHMDVWWQGQNVLVDGGSYLYNGPKVWHNHFMRTESHNTLTVDGRDQMLHFRRFKCLYWTQAKLLGFEDNSSWAVVAGEHTGFARYPGGCVHRRSVLFVKDDLWVVVDSVLGEGSHEARLHWLAGTYPYKFDAVALRLSLATPRGEFTVMARGCDGTSLESDVKEGLSTPPRGWLSRYYGEKVPAPSFAAKQRGSMPIGFVSVLAGGRPEASVTAGRWTIAAARSTVSFRLSSGLFKEIELNDTKEHGGIA